MKNKKPLTFYVVYMIAVIIFSNIIVDYISEGYLQTITEKPLRFFISSVVLGALGGFFIWKYADKWQS